MPSTTKRRPHVKRHGNHQRRSRHFLRVYTPYLPLIAIITTGLLISSYWKPRSGQAGVLAYATEMSSGALLNATNQSRNNNGAGGLALNSKLSNAAQAKANDMAARNYWAHNTPEGNAPWVFIANAGYSYSRAGENLAYGFATSNDTIVGWMNSQSHRENLLNKDYTEVGFGYTNASNYNNSGEETIIVAMYATPLQAAAPVPVPAPKPVTKQVTTTKSTPEPASLTKTVEVKIVDDEQKPVAGIKVTLHSEPREAITDADGVAIFKDVEVGQHTAIAEVDGAKTEQPVTVSTDAAIVSVTMAKPKLSPNATSISTTNKPAAIPTPKKVSRLDIMTGGTLPWAATALSTIALVGAAYVLGKHSRALHKLVIKGERYVLQHSVLDATIVSFVWLCYVVSRNVGNIL